MSNQNGIRRAALTAALLLGAVAAVSIYSGYYGPEFFGVAVGAAVGLVVLAVDAVRRHRRPKSDPQPRGALTPLE